MLAYDAKILGERLSDLAEIFDKKPVSEKGLTVWFNLLREFPTERVCSVLIGWPKTHTKFPAPAEVWKLVNDLGIGEREKKAQEENNAAPFYPGVGGEQAEKFIAQIRETLKNPKWSPAEHWDRLLHRSKPGTISHEYAKKALKGLRRRAQKNREPGQDDEEREAA